MKFLKEWGVAQGTIDYYMLVAIRITNSRSALSPQMVLVEFHMEPTGSI